MRNFWKCVSAEKAAHSCGLLLPEDTTTSLLECGIMSRALFTNHVSRIYDPKKHITDAIITIQANMLLRTRKELEYRMEVHATNGVTLRCTEAS